MKHPHTKILSQVTLAPFKKNVCQGANGVLNDIDAAMISEMREMLDDLEQMDMDIGDLIVNDASVAFKPLRENLQFLRAALRKYKLEQQKAMQAGFVLIYNILC